MLPPPWSNPSYDPIACVTGDKGARKHSPVPLTLFCRSESSHGHLDTISKCEIPLTSLPRRCLELISGPN